MMAVYTIYADTSDEYKRSASTTYSTARSGGTITTTDSNSLLVGQTFFSPDYFCYETFLRFDTSGVVGSITTALLNLDGYTNDSFTDFTVQARINDWGASPSWVAGGSLSGYTLVADFATASYSSGYNTFTNVALPANVNTSGTTKIMLNSSRHLNGNTPGGSEYVSFSSADSTGTTVDPYLYIETTGGTSRSYGVIFG